MAREIDEKEEKQTEKEEVKKKGSPIKLIILGVMGLLLIGGGVLFWQKGLFAQLSGKEQKVQAEKAEEKDSKVAFGPIFSMDSFIVNLHEPRERRYLKTKVDLELDNEETKAEVQKRLPQFKDSIITLLSSKTYSDVSDLTGKFQLRTELLTLLNGFLTKGKIRNIYFSEFIVQ